MCSSPYSGDLGSIDVDEFESLSILEPDREGGDASVAALSEGDFCGQERVSDEDCGAAPARLLADWSDIRSKAVDGRGVCEVIDTGVFLFEAQLLESDYVGFFNFCGLDGLFPCSFREGSSDIGGYDFEVGTLSFVPKGVVEYDAVFDVLLRDGELSASLRE